MRSKGSAWRKLMDQWLTAELNVLNGTCVPLYVQDIMNEAHTLLLQCQLQLSVYSIDAQPYKDLAAILESYNSGLIGPGHCENEACVNITSEFDTAACSIPSNSFYRSMIEDDETYGLTACDHGTYDWATDTCICFYGWGGLYCDECAAPSKNSSILICVPTRIPNVPYLLREIPIDQLDHYMGPFISPFTDIYHYPPTFPNTNGLDCFCQPTLPSPSHALTRDVVDDVEITFHSNNGDLIAYATMLQEDLGICEASWNVLNSFNHSNMPNLTVFVHVDTTQDEEDESWFETAFFILLPITAFILTAFIWLIFPYFHHSETKEQLKSQ
jgi:hypothetical protein